MSSLYFRVSWPQHIERYRELRKVARRNGRSLTVKNMSRKRGIPIFLFFLSQLSDPDQRQTFSHLDEVQAALAAIGGAV